MGKGLVVMLKLGLLMMVPLFWEHQVALLLLIVAVASVGAHMPSRFRHRCFFPSMQQLLAAPPRLSSRSRQD